MKFQKIKLYQFQSDTLDDILGDNKRVSLGRDYEADLARSSCVAEELLEGLNVDQRSAFLKLKNFALSQSDYVFVLKGYAGTGKTFLIKRLIEFLNRVVESPNIALTAPTNKAVRVISRSTDFKGKNVRYVTIHSLLGLREHITPSGQLEFVKSHDSNNNLTDIDFLVIDEVSMLDDKLFNDIYNNYRNKVRIILMGDPAQIPPVRYENCIPFRKDAHDKYKMEEAVIREIVRQGHGNPIIECSLAIRQNMTETNPLPDLQTKVDSKGNGIIILDRKEPMMREKIQQLLNQYFNCNAFQNDADFSKVIAWRNRTVDYFNKMVRDLIFGADAPQIVKGEKLIVTKPVMQEGDNKKKIIILTNSEELEVTNAIKTYKKVRVLGKDCSFATYRCLVSYYSVNGKRAAHIDILRDEGIQLFNDKLAELKREAIKQDGKNFSWARYYDFMREFAEVAYNYAITAHRAQGSTYGNVFLIEDDINCNSKIVERNRIKYTSYSRPTQKLFIIK